MIVFDIRIRPDKNKSRITYNEEILNMNPSQIFPMIAAAVRGSIERDQTCIMVAIAKEHTLVDLKSAIETALTDIDGSEHEGIWTGSWEGHRWSIVLELREVQK